MPDILEQKEQHIIFFTGKEHHIMLEWILRHCEMSTIVIVIFLFYQMVQQLLFQMMLAPACPDRATSLNNSKAPFTSQKFSYNTHHIKFLDTCMKH